MSADRLTDYLGYLLDAARQACLYVDGMDYDDFVADRRTQQAVIMNLMILGEVAAKMIEWHAQFLAEHPQVPWASMKGMRNRIAHGYFELDIAIVWGTVQTALPGLADQLQKLVVESKTANRGVHRSP